ncbi:rhomboid family intramembrane serine protease [Oceanicola sp. 502str15]|uniref:rhomboid family intramembrane serine protease n=1 Tax=Oceanicola sp. 502str15 TaxID=2696061 RepID=UPI0020946BD6|nr:rhomboid family intramembrane serine protease [Oceanicola sp. 502str15]MCO6381269.1 rhomboid family intramembrane serine protease [Oceanicola sp. 502str15]
MFPFRDHNPSRTTPWVTLGLIVANIAVYLLMTLPLNDLQLIAFYQEYGLTPARPEASDYLTAMFLHGGVMHLAGNMLFLWIYGDNLEDEMGHLPFLGFYLATGVVASFLHVTTSPGSPVPLVGASGAIAGVMGGYLLLFPKAKIDVLFIIVIIPKIWPIPAWIVLAIWFALQLVNGAASPAAGGGVAYWAHVGGFLAGVIGTLPWFLKEGAARWWQRTDGHPPHPDAHYGQLSNTSIPTVRRRK